MKKIKLFYIVVLLCALFLISNEKKADAGDMCANFYVEYDFCTGDDCFDYKPVSVWYQNLNGRSTLEPQFLQCCGNTYVLNMPVPDQYCSVYGGHCKMWGDTCANDAECCATGPFGICDTNSYTCR